MSVANKPWSPASIQVNGRGGSITTAEAATRLHQVLMDEAFYGYTYHVCFELIEEAEFEEARREGALPWHVAYSGQYGGSKRELDSPKSWRPGCIAFKKDASQIAHLIGGNYYQGGEEWNMLFNAGKEATV